MNKEREKKIQNIFKLFYKPECYQAFDLSLLTQWNYEANTTIRKWVGTYSVGLNIQTQVA